MHGIKAGVLLVVGLLIYTAIFNAVNPEVMFSMTKDTVTVAQLHASTDDAYIGYKAASDVPKVTDFDTLMASEDYVAVASNTGSALGLYKIKNKEDMENLKYIRNSKGRKVYDATKKIYEYVENPKSLKSYYLSYYLVGLSDGTYIVAYLDESYGKKLVAGKEITLPIGRLETMSSIVREHVEAVEGKQIHTDVVLNCFNTTEFIAHENMYVIMRGGIALASIVILYGVLCCIFPKARLWK